MGPNRPGHVDAGGTPLVRNARVVGIYTGWQGNGVGDAFADVTSPLKQEWIRRTMQNEALHIHELCGR